MGGEFLNFPRRVDSRNQKQTRMKLHRSNSFATKPQRHKEKNFHIDFGAFVSLWLKEFRQSFFYRFDRLSFWPAAGLNSNRSTGFGIIVIGYGLSQIQDQHLPGTMAQFGEQLTVKHEINSQSFWNAEHPLAVWHMF